MSSVLINRRFDSSTSPGSDQVTLLLEGTPVAASLGLEMSPLNSFLAAAFLLEKNNCPSIPGRTFPSSPGGVTWGAWTFAEPGLAPWQEASQKSTHLCEAPPPGGAASSQIHTELDAPMRAVLRNAVALILVCAV